MHDELFAMYWKDQERTNFYSHSPSQIYSGLLNVYQAGYRAALSDEPQGPYDDNGHMDADRDLERLIESGRQFRLRMAKSPDEAMNIALSANDLARIGFALRQLSKNTTKNRLFMF